MLLDNEEDGSGSNVCDVGVSVLLLVSSIWNPVDLFVSGEESTKGSSESGPRPVASVR